jgi:hypothetical protein
MRVDKIITFYREEQVDAKNGEGMYTRSAAKPAMLLNKLLSEGRPAILL